MEHVGAADIYITPYRQEAHVVSGTLAIALGAGKAIVSTPYWHAKELLAEKRGVLVPFENPEAIAEAVTALLENDAERHAMRKRAYLHSRGTTWPKTAKAYMASFQRARFERSLRPKATNPDDLIQRSQDRRDAALPRAISALRFPPIYGHNVSNSRILKGEVTMPSAEHSFLDAVREAKQQAVASK